MKKIYSLIFVLFLILLNSQLVFSETKKITDQEISEKYVRLTITDNFFITVSIATPDIIINEIDESIIKKYIKSEDRDIKIKEAIDFFNLDKGICVTIGILNKKWQSYKPNISGLSERIFIENDKGVSSSTKKIIRDISSSNLGEKDSFSISFPSKILTNENKNFYIIIRGIDKNSKNESQIKVKFPQEIVSYLIKQ